jgi:hypothetical protein
MMTLRVAADRAPTRKLETPLEVRAGHKWPWTKEVPLTVSDGSGCACSLLADDADWDAVAWSLRPEIRDSLARTIEMFGESLGTEFTFEAIWIGDKVRERQTVDLAELVDLARRGALGTRTRYLVSRVAA